MGDLKWWRGDWFLREGSRLEKGLTGQTAFQQQSHNWRWEERQARQRDRASGSICREARRWEPQCGIPPASLAATSFPRHSFQHPEWHEVASTSCPACLTQLLLCPKVCPTPDNLQVLQVVMQHCLLQTVPLSTARLTAIHRWSPDQGTSVPSQRLENSIRGDC